jgi:hypothetical protein
MRQRIGWFGPAWALCAALVGCAGGEKAATPGGEGSDGAADGGQGEADGAGESDGAGDGGQDTAPVDTGLDCVTDADHWSGQTAPLLAAECAGCHGGAGPAAHTRLVLQPLSEDGALEANLATFGALVAEDPTLPLRKPTGQTAHGGGVRFDVLDARYYVLDEAVARILSPGACAHPGPLPLRCDDGQAHPGTSPLRRLHAAQFEATVADVFGLALPAGMFPAAATADGAYRTAAQANTMSAAGVESVQLAAEWVAHNADLDAMLDCVDGAGAARPEADCARDAALRLGEALFRRPLLPAEADVLLRFIDAGLPPREGLGMAIEVMLQAPQTLYLDAQPVAEDDDLQPWLDDWALAARLSYFLTDAPPDAALRAAAASGALRTRPGVAAEAARLVGSARAVPVVVRFHEDWLHLYRLATVPKDTELYPLWDADLEQRLRDEQALFVGEVVWMGGGRLDDLLTDPAGWVDPSLALLFGLPAGGAGWRRVEHDGAQRAGVLTRPAFLAAHSYAASSAPIRRGAWVLEELLCQDLSPPAGVNTTLPEESADAPTIRERLAAHRADPACAGCHDAMDPIGFSFEHYDAIGAWRSSWESGIPVDATGSLTDPAGSFDGAVELTDLLVGSDRVKACYARRWFEYAVGRPAEPQDACSLDQLARRFEEADGDIRSLLIDVTLTDAFLRREAIVEGAAATSEVSP